MPVGVRSGMRRAVLIGSWVALVAALVLLWNHRYERVVGMPEWDLAGLSSGVPETEGVEWSGPPENRRVRLRVGEGTPEVALRLVIPEMPVVESLRVKFRLRATGLTPGGKQWQTGRLMIEWHPPGDGRQVERDTLGGVKQDEDSGRTSLVAVPADGPAVPAIVLEHLGRAGDFELLEMQVVPVRERAIWKTGRWILMAAGFSWVLACLRSQQRLPLWRAWTAAMLCLVMFTQFVVPGPWKAQKPLFGGDFRIGEAVLAEKATPLVRPERPLDLAPGRIAPTGEVQPRGALALRIKLALKPLRLLLHIALMAGPSFVFALLLGRRDAIRVSVAQALAIEAAQTAFGYGFDLVDVMDLAFDALGIALGVWLAGKARDAWRKRQVPSFG